MGLLEELKIKTNSEVQPLLGQQYDLILEDVRCETHYRIVMGVFSRWRDLLRNSKLIQQRSDDFHP